MSASIGRVTSEQVRREMIRTDRRESRRRFWIGVAVVLGAALLAGTGVARFLFALTDIRTTGMGETLESGDVVLCERMASPVRQAQLGRGSLALIQYEENGMQRHAVRRVIAMAGDIVTVEDDGRVHVNGDDLVEPYAAYRSKSEWFDDEEIVVGGALANPFASPDEPAPTAQADAVQLPVDDVEYPLTVPEGRLFVLCDDRDNAMDSRSSRFGLVDEKDVLGLARVVIWPVHRAGLLTDGGIQ